MTPKKRIESIYNFFKPMAETSVWGNEISVCVGWEYTEGYMEWKIVNDNVVFNWNKQSEGVT